MSQERYTGTDYLSANPDWHQADSPWKAIQVMRAFSRMANPGGPAASAETRSTEWSPGTPFVGWEPQSVCEIGCGAGGILRELHGYLPSTTFVGYEISPHPLRIARQFEGDRLRFELKDAADDEEQFDVMLVMDVIEHVLDPITFLRSIRHKSPRLLIHIPLDLSLQSILRRDKLLALRQTVGHIHYYTPETAIATVEDSGYTIYDKQYTAAYLQSASSLLAVIASMPRRLLPRSLVVRALGGYSMLLLAERTGLSNN